MNSSPQKNILDFRTDGIFAYEAQVVPVGELMLAGDPTLEQIVSCPEHPLRL
jgi:hypothetical protein